MNPSNLESQAESKLKNDLVLVLLQLHCVQVLISHPLTPSALADEESFVIAGTGEISNLNLVKDIVEVVEYLNQKE
jgi:hypothetical protein